jgi:eukaryotic-like serine/threonine-protein kinase
VEGLLAEDSAPSLLRPAADLFQVREYRAGDAIGHYRIEGKLGEGGMGVVYKARDTRLDRTVAIKISAADFSGRFEREVRAIAALNHPHICTLYDFGPNYLVMEYVEGRPLKGPLRVEEALRLAIQIAAALEAAHEKGILHRDLKPCNILVSKSGVKLLDFGLAKLLPTGLRPAEETDTAPLTGTGQILGTLAYMSPEQIEGKPADVRSDIFSLGLVFYEMLTGRRAFEAASQTGLMAAILKEEPPLPSALEPSIPPALDRTVRKCLEKDPARRWHTATDLRDELVWIAEGESPPGGPAVATAARVGRERLAWTVTTALAVLLMAAPYFTARHFTETAPARPVVRFRIEPPEGSELGADAVPALSHDGQRIAFSALVGGRPRIFIRASNADTAQALPGTEDGEFPFFSPDDRSLGFTTSTALKRFDLSTRAIQTIANPVGATLGVGPAAPGAWGPDGTILHGDPSGERVLAFPADGGAPRALTERGADEVGHTWPSFLPDGRHFLYSAADQVLIHYSVFAGSVDDPRFKKHLVDASGVAEYVEPGFLLYYSREAKF